MNFIVLFSILFSLIVGVYIYNHYNKNIETFQTFQQCRNLGYSKEFCVQTPTSLFGPAGCMCPDGSMGFVYPGLRGQCLCNHYGLTYTY
jgi:hypothetical protein